MEMLKEYGKVSARLDTLLPITVSILARMCSNCEIVLHCEYIACMFRAMYTATFYAVMRIGALATQAPNVIQHSQVTKLSNASGFMASVKLIFHQFKHHYNHFPRGAVASWLVRSTPDRAVLVRALAGDIVLCYLARNSTLTAFNV